MRACRHVVNQSVMMYRCSCVDLLIEQLIISSEYERFARGKFKREAVAETYVAQLLQFTNKPYIGYFNSI